MASYAQQLADLSGRIDQLRGEIPAAIAEGIRVSGARPAGEKGAPSLQFGVVEEVFDADGYADVTLDGQTAATAVNMLGGLVSGERVGVLLYPPSGNLAIGMVQPTTSGGVQSVVAGTNVTVDNTDPQNPIVSSTSSIDGSDALYGTPSQVVAASTTDDLSWILGDDPVGILDLTVPTLPTAVTRGAFIFTIEATTGSTLSAWSIFAIVREGGPSNRLANISDVVGPGTTTITLGVFMEAGDPIRIAIGNGDGANSGTFSFNISVVRIG